MIIFVQKDFLILTAACTFTMTLWGSAPATPVIDFADVLKKHNDDILHNNRWPKEFGWLPGYVLKKKRGQIEGAQALRQCIEAHGLQTVRIPFKFAYTTSTPPTDIVIAQKIEGSHGQPISIDQTKELCSLLKNAHLNNTYYSDIHERNLIHSIDGKIYIIDTKRSCWSTDPLTGLHDLCGLNTLTPEAKKWLTQELKK